MAPSVLLLDEPLTALDPNFREDIRGVLKTLHRDKGITLLMVTHDFAEAHFMARRTALAEGDTVHLGSAPEDTHLVRSVQQQRRRQIG